MILYHSLTSPYARKVRVLLLEKKVPFDAVNVAESARPVSEHNPLGKVPTLLLDDGTVLFDSSVISETLEALYPSPALLPADIRARALVRRWEALSDGICDVLVPVIIEARRPAEQQDRAYSERLEAKVRACFDYIEPLVDGREHLGNAFSLADISLVCALGYTRLRRPGLLEGRAKLAAYLDRQLARPSLRDTIPPQVPPR
ncbi:MAG TPA: glutathione S-transferase N-terminal domain-containing protein [Polyangiaceae bacterium]|nr:glutathione S-transferase N-terminal domain-containing protein [Polyangiaceae bacterium]